MSHTGQLAGANGEWIALGSGGAHSYSYNGGVTWASGYISNATLNAVSYGNGRWVIVANNGKIHAGNTLAAIGSVEPTLTAGGGYDSVGFIDGRFSSGKTAIRKLTSSGTLMPGFNVSNFAPVRYENDNTVYNITLLPSGSYVVSGTFVYVNNLLWKQVARFSSGGTLDMTYKLGDSFTGTNALGVAVLPDKNVLLAGAVGYSFDGNYNAAQYVGSLIQTNSTAQIDEAVSRQLEANEVVVTDGSGSVSSVALPLTVPGAPAVATFTS